MSITLTMIILWLAHIPGMHWVAILVGVGADLLNYVVKKVVGLEGER